MDPKEEGILLGELKAFRDEARVRFSNLEREVKGLKYFKIRIAAIGGTILGLIEVASRMIHSSK